MDIIELVRIGVRRKVAGEIIDHTAYQRQWMDDAPADADIYIRENIIDSGREEISQQRTKISVLCEFDIFVRRGAFPNPLAIASDYADRIGAAFDPKDPETIAITLDDGSTAYVQDIPYQGSPAQEEELFMLPVLFNVGVYI